VNVVNLREADTLTDVLRAGSVPRDGVLFVHCAFRTLGAEGWRADATIDALLNYMRDGTLVMPTMSWRIVTPANPIFDEIATPSHVGVLAETFRTRYASHRSLHPTHSVAARGKLADVLTARHHLDDTPCSPNSPYGLATRENAHVLLVGVGLERCTAIHHAEEMIAPEVYLRPPHEAEIYECRSRTGMIARVRLRRHIKLNRDYPQFTDPLAEKGQLLQSVFADTRFMIVSQLDLLAEVSRALRRDSRAIIAPPGAPIIP
jgi:aminoglycoside 3-N-acetyltransferase